MDLFYRNGFLNAYNFIIIKKMATTPNMLALGTKAAFVLADMMLINKTEKL